MGTPPDRRPWEFTWRLRLLEWAVRLANRYVMREVSGRENIPLEGGFIAVANHLSFADGILLAGVLDNHRRQPVHFISYSELFDIPFVSWILRTGEGIVLERRHRGGIEKALKEAEDYIVNKRHGVALFPEAHIARPEKMRRGRPGAALLAMRTGAPVLPCGLVGFERLIPLDRATGKPAFSIFNIRRRMVEVHIGKPMNFQPWRDIYIEADEKTRDVILRGLTTLMMRVVAGLSRQHYPFEEEPLQRAAEMVSPLPEWVKEYL